MPGKNPAVVPIQCEDKKFETKPPQEHACSMPRGSRIAVINPFSVGRSSPQEVIYIPPSLDGSVRLRVRVGWAGERKS